MTRVVIVGEAYMADLRPDQGLPPGQGGIPSHPIYNPPGIWGPTDPRPTPPIVIIPPDCIEPGVPTHPIYLPIYPSHPIVIPPGSLGPGTPEHPIYLPVYPSHPIVIPPDAAGPGKPEHPIVLPPPYPDQGLPGHQPYPDQGLPSRPPGYPDQGLPPFPSHPIVIPPEAIIPGEDGTAHVVVYANTSQGLQRITFNVDLEGGLKPPTHPTPKS